MWTMLKQKASQKWELVKDDLNSETLVQTGYTSSDQDVMSSMVAYMNHGIRGNLPDYIVDDLNYFYSI